MSRIDYPWELPAAIERRLGRDSYGAQRAIHEGGHLLLVLHEPPAKAGGARQHSVFLRRPDGQWLHHGQPGGESALTRLLGQYQSTLDNAQRRYEKADSAESLFELIEKARPLARAAANLHSALQAAREAAGNDTGLITARDHAADLARGLELLHADAQSALSFRLARNAEEQTQAAMAGTRAQNKLNTIAALTFPLMTVAAVFGMNLRSGMEGWAPLWFWLVFAAGATVGWLVKNWVQGGTQPPAGAASKSTAPGQKSQGPKKR